MRRKKPEEDGYSYLCAICEDFGELLCCERCRQGFHLACIGLSSCPEGDSWLCDSCSQNKVVCFDCKEYGQFKENVHRCGVSHCGKIYHDHCIKQWDRPQTKGRAGVVCPHHYCDDCWNGQSTHPGQDSLYKCLKCPIAYHEICIPDGAGLLEDIPGYLLCAKHNEYWKCQNDDKAPTEDVKVAFARLPLPSVPQHFKLPMSLKVAVKRLLNRPAPYVHIRRNIYLVKRPRKKAEEESTQCSCHASADSTGACDKDCLCGMLFTSCSSICKCGDACTNLSFQKRPGRKLKAVKTGHCGWGLKADEDIKAGNFLVEYVGEVIDDETCEKRLWAMKEQGESNFYMCEISREIVIDATFKGNLSRFINHSCSPNSELQKWDIDGEIRIGVFATQDIKKGEFVSYDYQFIQFGTDQKCHCGASGCRGQLGKPHKQKAVVEMPVKATREALLTRPSRKSKLYGSFSIERRLAPVNGCFGHQENSLGASLKVVQADVQHQHKGRDCVGLRVRVWWPLDQKFYHGKIVRYDSTIDKHQIMYDDGQEEDLHMAKERWEVEQTKPSRPKRSRSPALDEKTDKSLVVRLRRGRAPALDEMTDKSLVVRFRRGPSPALDEKNGKAHTYRLKSRLSSIEDKTSSEPALDANGGKAHVVEYKRRQSSSAFSKRDKSTILVYKRNPPAVEKKTSVAPQMEWRRTRSRMLRRTRSKPFVSMENTSLPPVSRSDGNHALTVCDDDSRCKENSNESLLLQVDRINELVICENSTPCKENSCESPLLQCDRIKSLIVCEDLSRCNENVSAPPVLESDASNAPIVCEAYGRCKENGRELTVLEGGKSKTLVISKEKSSESPGSEGDGSNTVVISKEKSSESSGLEGDGSNNVVVRKENSSESAALEGDESNSLIRCNGNSTESRELEGERSNTLVTCKENGSEISVLESYRSNTLVGCTESRSESSGLEGDESNKVMISKENSCASPGLEVDRSNSVVLYKENGSESPVLEGDRINAVVVVCMENSSESSGFEGDRSKTAMVSKESCSELRVLEGGRSNILILCKEDSDESPVFGADSDTLSVGKDYTRQNCSQTTESTLDEE